MTVQGRADSRTVLINYPSVGRSRPACVSAAVNRVHRCKHLAPVHPVDRSTTFSSIADFLEALTLLNIVKLQLTMDLTVFCLLST